MENASDLGFYNFLNFAQEVVIKRRAVQAKDTRNAEAVQKVLTYIIQIRSIVSDSELIFNVPFTWDLEWHLIFHGYYNIHLK